MAKYIIDIPDDSDTKYTYDQDTKELKFPSPRIDFTSLMGLEIVLKNIIPYTEPDRKVIEDEVWEFCMNTDWSWISEVGTKPLGDYTYQEAKAKYEAWLKQKDEICAGDELKDDENIRAVVLDIRTE